MLTNAKQQATKIHDAGAVEPECVDRRATSRGEANYDQ
jgi:hypothetical protein